MTVSSTQVSLFLSGGEAEIVAAQGCVMHWYWVDYNPGQNICNKIEKSSKTGQDKKSLIYTFACFLTASAKV